MANKIAIDIAGTIEVHASPYGAGDYDTLCGVDGSDPELGHNGLVPVPRGAKIDCDTCKRIWQHTKLFRVSDFK